MTRRQSSSKVWRLLADFWTFVAFAIIVADFYKAGTLEPIVGPVLAIYVAVLAIFSAEKEFERWHLYNTGRHRGEVYVVLWTVLVIGLFVASQVTHNGYELGPEVFSTYIVVLGILAVTRKSKEIFTNKKSRLRK